MAARLVPLGRVCQMMGSRRRSFEELRLRSPERLLRQDEAPTEIVETIVGFLESLGVEAEVLMLEEGERVAYSMPTHHFVRLGIQEGDEFRIEILRRKGKIGARIVAAPAQRVAEPEGGYLSPEDLDGMANGWE